MRYVFGVVLIAIGIGQFVARPQLERLYQKQYGGYESRWSGPSRQRPLGKWGSAALALALIVVGCLLMAGVFFHMA